LDLQPSISVKTHFSQFFDPLPTHEDLKHFDALKTILTFIF